MNGEAGRGRNEKISLMLVPGGRQSKDSPGPVVGVHRAILDSAPPWIPTLLETFLCLDFSLGSVIMYTFNTPQLLHITKVCYKINTSDHYSIEIYSFIEIML